MKLKLEYLNIGTGACLCIAGLLYLLQQDYITALNWGIFGAMYLVMDSYKPYSAAERDFSHLIREIFGVIGFTLSVILLLYILFV